MDVIKFLYDKLKDTVLARKRAYRICDNLIREATKNRNILADVEKGEKISIERKKQIIDNLALDFLSETLSGRTPHSMICDEFVDRKIIGKLKINRVLGYNFMKIVEKLYVKITYLKKDYANDSIDLNSRLIYVCKYNLILLKLLAKVNHDN